MRVVGTSVPAAWGWWMESRVELFARIRCDARVENLSIRELARRHGVGRPTVRQALASAEPPPPKKPRVRSAPRLEPFTQVAR